MREQACFQTCRMTLLTSQVHIVDDLRLAPFHAPADEVAARLKKIHRWHPDLADRLFGPDARLFRTTQRRYVSLFDPASEAAAMARWNEVTGTDNEGMVFNPIDGWSRARKGRLRTRRE